MQSQRITSARTSRSQPHGITCFSTFPVSENSGLLEGSRGSSLGPQYAGLRVVAARTSFTSADRNSTNCARAKASNWSLAVLLDVASLHQRLVSALLYR